MIYLLLSLSLIIILAFLFIIVFWNFNWYKRDDSNKKDYDL